MKKVYFILSDNTFHRYIYIFVKFFIIEGYTVYIKFNFKFIRSLTRYSELLKKEKKVKFYFFNTPNDAFVISDRKGKGNVFLSPDLFSKINGRKLGESYIVPISMHPLMYSNGIWNKETSPSNRKFRSAVFIGATSGYSIYDEGLKNFFKVTNREKLLSFLVSQPFSMAPTSKKAFNTFSQDNKIVIVDRKHIKVSQDELLSCFQKYYFFMAASGYAMPLCHNLAEAMAVGVIPIIEQGYASLLEPALQHEINAVVYNDLNDLSLKIKEAFKMPKEKLEIMGENALSYYNEYLTPKAVINKVLSGSFSVVYLNAEEESVKLLDKA